MPVGTTQMPKALFAILCHPFVRPRHAHSIVPGHNNILNYKYKAYLMTINARQWDRQNSLLLILKGNSTDQRISRLQRQSRSIGRFLKSSARTASSVWPRKDRQSTTDTSD